METESPDPTTYEGGTSILHYLQEESKRHEEGKNLDSPSPSALTEDTRTDSMDADSLSRAEKGQRIENMLKKKKRQRRKRKGNFRAETARILEEFLQSQLDEQSVQTSPSKHYQRYVELDVTETTTPSGESSGYGQSKTSLLREDSIPFIDDDDEHELRKSESLPHDELANLHIEGKRGSIHHGKSKSDPHQNKIKQISEDEFKKLYPKLVRPTPSGPPGTPLSPSEEDSNGVKPASHSRVPYTGTTRTDSSLPSSYERMSRNAGSSGGSSLVTEDIPGAVVKGNHVVIQVSGGHEFNSNKEKTPPIPTTLPLPSSNHGHKSKLSKLKDHKADMRAASPNSRVMKNFVQTGKKSKKSSSKVPFTGSGYLSSDEHENSPTYSEDSHGRKKSKVKTIQRAKSRISSFFKRHVHPPSSDEDEKNQTFSNRQNVSKNRKKQKKKSNEDEDMDVDEVDIFQLENSPFDERVVTKHRSVRQKHTGQNRDTVLREEAFKESIETFRNGVRHHTEIRGRVKESSGGGRGFFSRLSQRFSPKKRSKEITDSHSSQPSTDEVDSRVHSDAPDTISGLDHPDDASMAVRMSEGGFAVTRFDSQPQNGSLSHCHVSQSVSKAEMKRHSSHIDILDDRGNVIDCLEFDGGDELPRNRSFTYEKQTSIREKRVRSPDGSRIVRDEISHDHFEFNEGGDTTRDVPDKQMDSMNADEKEEVYGKIASRLAAMGDNLMAERGGDILTPGSSCGTRSDSSPEKAKSPETEFQPKPMEPWEKELSDELKRFADNLDEKLQADARTAAIKITGMMTYNTFKSSVQESVGNEVGWNQIAAVFQITKRAVQAAGAGGAMAAQIKEITLKYIEDRFAHFIVGQGGWDSMLSDDSGTDSELD